MNKNNNKTVTQKTSEACRTAFINWFTYYPIGDQQKAFWLAFEKGWHSRDGVIDTMEVARKSFVDLCDRQMRAIREKDLKIARLEKMLARKGRA